MEATAAHIDRFGNVILWLFSRQYADLQPKAAELPCGKTVPVTCTGTYGNENGLLFLRGSQGCMELSLSGGSAAEEFGIERGMRIRLLTGKPGITEDQ